MVVTTMENLYQPPSGPCSNSERRFFWDKIIDDQNASGISMKKFCNLHKLKLSTYRSHKYRKRGVEINRCGIKNHNVAKNIQRNNCAAKFIPLQIATDAAFNKCNKGEGVYNGAPKIQVIFKNKHRLVLPLATSEANLLLIVKAVAGLPC